MEIEKYFILEELNLHNSPMLNLKRNLASRLLGLSEVIESYDDFEFEFTKYSSMRSQMTDYHYHSTLLLSKHVTDILKNMNLYMVDYLDASLTDRKNNTNYDYHVVHVRNHIECFDKEHSAWKPPAYDPNEVMSIKIMTLNWDKLSLIPQEKRLLFRLKEATYYTLFHESVVDAILATKPTNMRFISVESWCSNNK